MKVLELFSGTEHISNEFRRRGHGCFTVDWKTDDERVQPSLVADIGNLTANDILARFGRPDVIWAAPDCTTFSPMARHLHRQKNEHTGEWEPRSQYAKFCDKVDQHMLQLIADLEPKVFIIENPKGAMRTMSWMQFTKPQTTRYSLYGAAYPKPTDFWSNINLHLKTHGEEHITKGLKDVKDRVERSMYPPLLVHHMVNVVEQNILF